MNPGLRILLVDDDPDVRLVLRTLLDREGHTVHLAPDGEAALLIARGNELDVVLLDLDLGSSPDGFLVLEQLKALDPQLPVVILSNSHDPDTVVRAMKAGAAHFIGKSPRYDELSERLRLAVQERQRALQLEIHRRPESVFLPTSPRLEEIIAMARRVADESSPLLILGETGTGKSLLARSIHHWSRERHPYQEVNVAALPATLLDSELFGHERGAFTGADQRRRGLFEVAAGGSILLDEIGDLSRECQIKLLQVIDCGKFRRLGSDRDLVTTARIITATHQDLQGMVAQGTFRRDLYHRLVALTLRIPPLREHPESIPALARLFMEPNFEVTPEGLALLKRQLWPGNVRELHQVLRQSKMFAANQRIGPAELIAALQQGSEAGGTGADRFGGPYAEAAERFRRDYFVKLLDRHSGNVSHAAREAEIDRSHLHTLLKKLGIARPADGEANDR